MKTKILRALAAALIAGTLLLSGAAPLGMPDIDVIVHSAGG